MAEQESNAKTHQVRKLAMSEQDAGVAMMTRKEFIKWWTETKQFGSVRSASSYYYRVYKQMFPAKGKDYEASE